MALWGVGLGLGLGAAYGTLVGIIFFTPFVWFGPPLGAMYSTIAGLPLGVLEGVVLGVVTVLRYRGDSPDVSLRYRRAAELACVVTCVLAVALFFGLSVWISGVSVTEVPSDWREDDLPFLLIVAVGPALVAVGAVWWTARRVAGQYMDEIGEPVNRSPTQATGENLVEKARKR
jgi:hypothetical protein